MDQSIEQLNDVTAVSGVNLRVSFAFPDSFSFHFKSGCVVLNKSNCCCLHWFQEEEEQLFSGGKEDSRVSEASRRVVHEEEERLILQKSPLQNKLAKIS